ncbi:hypothetical protein HOLleu_32139 [Holothuria leucospilota]|uniref:Uncharacterized protein n=1 Tax=Holothuria leucospilota TaxID=206669 RepID=A0A9Q0YR85_HOLLE|nr:hypothetical protein HOLleu_32139 [Holothuria leucospilota]
MDFSRCVPILYLFILCATATPVDKQTTAEVKPTPDIPLQFSKDEPGSGKEEILAQTSLKDEDEGKDTQDGTDFHDVGIIPGPGDAVDDSELYSEYGSLPSWYIDELFNSENESQPQTEEYRKYKSELDELILDVKLYQVYHSIKTLKNVLDDLIAEELGESVDSEGGKGKKQPTRQDIGRLEKDNLERQAVLKKQLETLRNKQEDQKPRRFKRDLSWGEDSLTSPLGDRNLEEGEPDLSWLVKFDDLDNLSDFQSDQDIFDLNNEFEMSKQELRDLLSTFDPHFAPYGNQVNINVGDQKLSQEIWYPKKRGSPQTVDRNFLNRLPTLEGMRKRRRTYMPFRGSRNEKSILDLYRQSDEPMMKYNQALFRNEIARLARKLARNTPRAVRLGSNPRDRTTASAGDVNMWFENNPMYNIGVDDNIGDTFGLMQLDLPRGSPDPYDDADELQAYYERRTDPRIQRRAMYVEEPSLPGPYQGYFVEGQLWHDVLQKRASPNNPRKPEKLKIGGPNAWGNFIFINDKGELPGEWLTQSFGDDINNGGMPGQIQTEGMWVDGFDETQNERNMYDQEKAWIRRILGIEDDRHDKRGSTLF